MYWTRQMTRDEALSTSVSVAIRVTQDGDVVSFDRSAFKKNLAKAGFAIVPLEPTKKMVVNGDEAAITRLQDHSFALKDPRLATLCYVAMIAAYEKEQVDGVPSGNRGVGDEPI